MKRRLFLALPISKKVRDELELALRGRIPPREIPSENWHITLLFLGSTSDEAEMKLCASIDSLSLGNEFSLALGGLGGFPRAERAAVLWLGITEGVERLKQLHQQLCDVASDLKFKIEPRDYHPHLTLARMKAPQNVKKFIDTLDSLEVSFEANQVVLYESIPSGNSVRYIERRSWKLMG